MDHGYGPLPEIRRYSLTQLIRFSKAADKRDRHKQAALIEAAMLGQDPKVASEKIKELLGTTDAAKSRKPNRSKRKRNRKRPA
jgi:hypothetical protein